MLQISTQIRVLLVVFSTFIVNLFKIDLYEEIFTLAGNSLGRVCFPRRSPPAPLFKGENLLKVPLSCSKFWGSKATPKIRAVFNSGAGGNNISEKCNNK